jgi:hypothetical protein
MIKRIPFANLKNNKNIIKLEEQNLRNLIGGGPTQTTVE